MISDDFSLYVIEKIHVSNVLNMDTDFFSENILMIFTLYVTEKIHVSNLLNWFVFVVILGIYALYYNKY